MEPKNSSPEMNLPGPERTPENSPNTQSPESTPEIPLQSPEYGDSSAPERAAEQSNVAQAALSAQPIPVTLPTPVPVQDDIATQGTQDDDLPAVAGDDDLIEKEWVDKAKQIIVQTKDDPAERERQVGRLQADYLRKRYGKELGATE